jgi:hypothetical protein
MVCLIDLLVEGSIAGRFGNSIADAGRTIEVWGIEARRASLANC